MDLARAFNWPAAFRSCLCPNQALTLHFSHHNKPPPDTYSQHDSPVPCFCVRMFSCLFSALAVVGCKSASGPGSASFRLGYH